MLRVFNVFTSVAQCDGPNAMREPSSYSHNNKESDQRHEQHSSDVIGNLIFYLRSPIGKSLIYFYQQYKNQQPENKCVPVIRDKLEKQFEHVLLVGKLLENVRSSSS